MLSPKAAISASGSFGPTIYRKKRGDIGWNMKQVHFEIANMTFHITKDRNLSRICTTSLIRRQNHNGEVVDRSWLCFCPAQTCISLVDWCSRIQLNVRIYLLEKESSTEARSWAPEEPRAFNGTYRCHDYIQSQMQLITMKNWYRTIRSGQSMPTKSEIASACNVWFLS